MDSELEVKVKKLEQREAWKDFIESLTNEETLIMLKFIAGEIDSFSESMNHKWKTIQQRYE